MSNSSQSLPLSNIRYIELGTMRTDIKTANLDCGNTSVVTRLDMQTVVQDGFGGPYISGLRMYCSGHPPGQFQHSLNWHKLPYFGRASFLETVGGSMAGGIQHVIAAHAQYIHLLGYGESTVVGAGAGARKLWQQAIHRELVDCRLQGIEVTWFDWIDGMRLLFSCPPTSTPNGSLLPLPSEPNKSHIPGSAAGDDTCSPLFPGGIGFAVGILFISSVVLLHSRLTIGARRGRNSDNQVLIPLLQFTAPPRSTVMPNPTPPWPAVAPLSSGPLMSDLQEELCLPQMSEF